MHSIFGFFARVAGTPTQPPVIALVVAIILGLFGVYMGRSVLNKGHQLLSLIIIGDVTLLISPVTWIATMVWIVPTLIWLAFAKWKNKTKLPYAIGFIVLIWHIIPIYWFAQRVGDAIPYQTTLLGNLLATIGSPLFPISLFSFYPHSG
jgi:hypothetical protein